MANLVVCFFFKHGQGHRRFMDHTYTTRLTQQTTIHFFRKNFPSMPGRCRSLVELFHQRGNTFPCTSGGIHFFCSNGRVLSGLLHSVTLTQRRVRLRFCVVRSSQIKHTIYGTLTTGTHRKIGIQLVCSSIKY